MNEWVVGSEWMGGEWMRGGWVSGKFWVILGEF